MGFFLFVCSISLCWYSLENICQNIHCLLLLPACRGGIDLGKRLKYVVSLLIPKHSGFMLSARHWCSAYKQFQCSSGKSSFQGALLQPSAAAPGVGQSPVTCSSMVIGDLGSTGCSQGWVCVWLPQVQGFGTADTKWLVP